MLSHTAWAAYAHKHLKCVQASRSSSLFFLRQMKFGIKYIQKVYPIQKVSFSQTCFLASTYFRIFLLLCRAWRQSRLADHGRSDFWCKHAIEKRFSPQLSSTYCSFREEGMFCKVKRHEVHTMCQDALWKCRATHSQKGLPSREAAGVLDPRWRILYLIRQACAASLL